MSERDSQERAKGESENGTKAIDTQQEERDMNIIVNGHEYDNEKDAKKAMGKAKKAEEKQEAIAREARSSARRLALEKLDHLLYHLDKVAQHETSHYRRVPYAAIGKKAYEWSERLSYTYTYETEEGSQTYIHKHQIPLAFVFSGNGYVVAVLLQDNDDTANIRWCTVGIYGSEIYFLPIPTIVSQHIDSLETWDRYHFYVGVAA